MSLISMSQNLLIDAARTSLSAVEGVAAGVVISAACIAIGNKVDQYFNNKENNSFLYSSRAPVLLDLVSILGSAYVSHSWLGNAAAAGSVIGSIAPIFFMMLPAGITIH